MEEKTAVNEKITERVIEDEMKQSYLDYAMSVIVGRALPDVKDGLKPAHRRVLYTMYELALFHNKPFKKSARIVGDCLGKYHPHGDVAVYDTLVRMAQDFSLRYPLVRGQGNFGSVDGDSAASMRYTEAKLSKISEEMLQDIEKETVRFVPNFDSSLKEPVVLPSKLPNLLVNGSSGIAVGMATNIPPHNLVNVANSIIRTIDNPNISAKELIETIKGPDFPTGALIYGRFGINQAYMTGSGKIRVRAKTKTEEHQGKKRIIITEIPYQVNKSQLVEEIAFFVRGKVIKGISDIRDESDREGMRVVIELKKDADAEVVLNQLYNHTKMQTTFGINMLALVNNEPKVLNFRELVQHHIDFRKEIVTKRTEFDLGKAASRAHIIEGLIIALNSIDKTIEIIKKSKSVEDAKTALLNSFKLSDEQVQAILDMKLQRLTSLEQEKIKEEHKSLLKLIEELKAILADRQKILNIIKKELNELKEKYGDERRTQIVDVEMEEGGIEEEDMVAEEDDVITITHTGYIKRLPVNTYKQQNRGGKGVIAAGTNEGDVAEHLFIANTRSYILFFTNRGKVYWLKVYQIPEATRQAKGKAIINLIHIENDEKITAFIPVREFDSSHHLTLATEKGIVKKTNLSEYSNPRSNGIIAITLEKDDNLIKALLTDGSKKLIVATRNGMAVRFDEKQARSIGRTSKGVIGIRLKGDDRVIGMEIAENEKTLLTVTENGYGKRTKISEYRQVGRGSIGVINIQCSERNGKVVDIKSVIDEEEIMLISKNGIIIRVPVSRISVIGRNTQGVRLMKLSEEDKVADCAKIAE